MARAINRSLPSMSAAGYIVLDTETTGLGADARAIELGLVFLDSMGSYLSLREIGASNPWMYFETK